MTDIEPEGTWFNRPVLPANEKIVAAYPANHTQGKRAVGGKLFLTSRRLLFVPNRFEQETGGNIWEIPIQDIQSVGRDTPNFSIMHIFSGAWRSRLSISTGLGQGEFFVVNRLDKVIAELNARIHTQPFSLKAPPR